MEALLQAIAGMQGRRLLVLGDVMLDSYHAGSAGRLCREAPVPIVSVGRRTDMPGGAGNAAANARALGAHVRLLGLVGPDENGGRLRASLSSSGVSPDDLVEGRERQTLAKQRILADGQLLMRFDQGSVDPPDRELQQLVNASLAELHEWSDAILVSDYGYGAISQALIDRLAGLQERARRPLVIDAKDLARLAVLHPTAVKPNYSEAAVLSGTPVAPSDAPRDQLVVGMRDQLLARTGAESAAVTLDADGCVLLRRGHPPYRTYARRVSNDHAAGAGDTFAACLALGLAAGADPTVAVDLASAAAAVAVSKEGTATCSAAELRGHISGTSRIGDLATVVREVAHERSQGKRIVFTNGCFDILHRGHIAYLNRAKALGDVLVVAVNDDQSVRRLKGPDRPINGLATRVEMLAALSCIDHIVPFADDSPEELIGALRPEIFAKGGDYTENRLPEADLVRSLGGEVQILPLVPDVSTTRLIERIGAAASGGVGAWRP